MTEETKPRTRKAKASPDASDSCSSCRFWLRDTEPVGSDVGMCRVNAPQIVTDEESVISLWPTTCDKDWCGQYQRVTH